MAKAEWGQKRTCPTCGARFYDMRRETVACPVCDAVFDPERLPKSRRGSAAVRDDKQAAPAARKAAAVEADVDGLDDADPEVELDDDDDDTDTDSDSEEGGLIEDTSDLGEDDDDIGEVMEHVDDDDKG